MLAAHLPQRNDPGKAAGLTAAPAAADRREMGLRILVTAARLEPPGPDMLREAGCAVDYLPRDGDRAAMEALLAAHPYDGVISRAVPISAAAMASCPTLRVISRPAVGHDIIDIAAATARGIPVLTAVGANAQSVAEFAAGLMLAAARDIPRHDRLTQAGGWERSPLGVELQGRGLGLVGYGRIARAFARIALGIGMRVAAWSPHLHLAGEIAPVRRAPDLPALLAQAEVLSLHAPLTAETRGLIGAAELALLPRGAILVNTGRGGLIEEAALAEALRSGHLRAAALDVRAEEPPPVEDPLRGLPNLILTPHVAATTAAARARTARIAVAQMLDVLQGRPVAPGACVNPQALAGTSR